MITTALYSTSTAKSMAKMQIKSIFFTQLHKGKKNLNDGFLSSPQQVSFEFNCHLGIDAPTHCLVHFNVISYPVVPLAECIKILKKTVLSLILGDLCVSVSTPDNMENVTALVKCVSVHKGEEGRCTDLDGTTAYACCWHTSMLSSMINHCINKNTIKLLSLLCSD